MISTSHAGGCFSEGSCCYRPERGAHLPGAELSPGDLSFWDRQQTAVWFLHAFHYDNTEQIQSEIHGFLLGNIQVLETVCAACTLIHGPPVYKSVFTHIVLGSPPASGRDCGGIHRTAGIVLRKHLIFVSFV